MLVSFRRQQAEQLRMPPVCAVSGLPAAGTMTVWFRHRSRLRAGLLGSLLDAAHPPARVSLPAAEPVLARHRRLQVGAGVAVAVMVIGFLLLVIFGTLLGVALCVVLMCGGLVALTLVQRRLDVLRTDVDHDRLSMQRVAPGFATALAELNPGVVELAGSVPDQP